MDDNIFGLRTMLYKATEHNCPTHNFQCSKSLKEAFHIQILINQLQVLIKRLLLKLEALCFKRSGRQ